MGGADFGGGEDRDERDVGDGGFDVGTATLFTIDEAEDTGDVHSGFASGFDGGDGGSAGGADVVDDDDVSTKLKEAFDSASCAVGFLSFADEESVDECGSWIVVAGFVYAELEFVGESGDLGVVGERPGAGAGGVRDEGVCSHGEATYGFGVGDVLADEVMEDETGEASAFGVESCNAAVDVVVGFFAAGEGEVSEFEGVGGDEVEEGGASVVRFRHGWLDCNGGEFLLPLSY
jgi:hypothetical protein